MKWITTANVHFDRLASPWLIKRFIDPNAEFLFEAKGQEDKRPKDAIPIAIPGAKLGPHDKDGPTFLKIVKNTSANRVCQERFRLRFDQLAASDASAFLRDIAGGRVIDAQMSLATWSNQLVDPLLIQACFAGPIYDGYCNRVFWKLFGHPGEPA